MSSDDPSKCFKCEKPKSVVYRVRARFDKFTSGCYNMVVWMCKLCLEEIEQ